MVATAERIKKPPSNEMSLVGVTDDDATDSGAVADKAAHDDAHALSLIREAEKRVAAAESDLDEATAVKKEKQALFDSAVDALRRIIREQSEELPLFAAEEQDWEGVSLLDLPGIPAAAVKAMSDKEIRTIGELSKWTATYPLTDIKGIGPGAAEKIESALEKFWADRKVSSEGSSDSQQN